MSDIEAHGKNIIHNLVSMKKEGGREGGMAGGEKERPIQRGRI